MTTLLKLTTSIFGEGGASSQLADAFASRWLAARPGASLIERDLAKEPPPHLTAEAFAGFGATPGERSSGQQHAVDYSDGLIDELRRADVLVLGLPMYNFNVPSALKAYFDHVARAGETFRYTASGPVGLLTGKKAYVFATRGGVYTAGAAEHETSYVRQMLSFLGIDDVEVVIVEGLALGDASRSAALAAAEQFAERLHAGTRSAA